jgi:hypothetical protein
MSAPLLVRCILTSSFRKGELHICRMALLLCAAAASSTFETRRVQARRVSFVDHHLPRFHSRLDLLASLPTRDLPRPDAAGPAEVVILDRDLLGSIECCQRKFSGEDTGRRRRRPL